MNFTECDVTVMLAESREACKHIRKLSMLWKTVVTHRLEESKHLRTAEKLAAWRRLSWFRSVRCIRWAVILQSPTPHAERNYRKHVERCERVEKEILMSQPPKKQRAERMENFLNEIESCTDEGLAKFERIIMERRRRAAVHPIVASIGTALAHPSNLDRAVQKNRSMYVFVWRKTPRARWTPS